MTMALGARVTQSETTLATPKDAGPISSPCYTLLLIIDGFPVLARGATHLQPTAYNLQLGRNSNNVKAPLVLPCRSYH